MKIKDRVKKYFKKHKEVKELYLVGNIICTTKKKASTYNKTFKTLKRNG